MAERRVRRATVFESMAGERPRIVLEMHPSPPVEKSACWRQTFAGVPSATWVSASEKDRNTLGKLILLAAGLTDADIDDATSQGTYQETLGQGLSGLAQSMTARLEREITPAAGEPAPAQEGVVWTAFHMTFSNLNATVFAGFEPAFLDALALPASMLPASALPASPPLASGPAFPASDEAFRPAGNSKTFDLLLEVELPVSVSFGRAQIQLKDVLKLATGSIVELNRAVSEPVEIIVNNCVIARGEVVVVEGNFGVRIQQVISRAERLRTLN